jgi:hypothetical protein
MNDLMNLIDDVKESIPEGKYLELCNAMKSLYTNDTKKTHEAIQPTNPSPRSVIIDTLYVNNTYSKLYKLKKDRKITFKYGTTANVHVPHTVLIDEYPAEFTTDRNIGDDVLRYTIDKGNNLKFVLTFDMDIKTNMEAMCVFEICLHNLAVLSYEVNELTIKRLISNKYN